MKLVITARNFSTGDKTALHLLQQAGFEITDYSDANIGTGTSDERMAELLQDAEVAILGLEPLSAATIASCPKLKLVSKRSIGYDTLDVEACRKAGIAVTRATGTVEAAVAEQILAYILYFSRRVDLQNAHMHAGKWRRLQMPGAKSRRLGLIGFGGIGKEAAKRAVAMDMQVSYYSRHPQSEWEQQYGVTYKDFDQLLATSDYVCACVPLSPATTGMFGAREFAMMPKGSIFLNIARSQVADVEALREALLSGHLAGAGIDVFPHEPCTDSILMDCPTALLTPHTAPYTQENFCLMNNVAAQNVLDYFKDCVQADRRLV